MRKGRKILLVILAVLVIIQLIRPARNQSNQVLPTAISSVYSVPDNVQQVLKQACYDCHSNSTRYPWYANIQPFAWWLAHHINEGKRELNFSEFGSYPLRKQRNKLQGIANSIKDDEMPIGSYKLMHAEAHLSAAEKDMIMYWALKTKNSLTTSK